MPSEQSASNRVGVIVAADQIASGLVDLLDAIYQENVMDVQYRGVLAAANTLAVKLDELRSSWS